MNTYSIQLNSANCNMLLEVVGEHTQDISPDTLNLSNVKAHRL